MGKALDLSKSYTINANGCWIWAGAISSAKYGNIRFRGRQQGAHRVFFQLYKGEIPEGLFVLHKCDVKSCVNPDHLFLGNAFDNMRDAGAKRRLRWGSKHPKSKLTPAQVRSIRASSEGPKALGLKYGVSTTAICYILSGKNWKNLL